MTFTAIVSYSKRGATEIERRKRCDELMKYTWEDTKKGDPKVRASGSIGSDYVRFGFVEHANFQE